MTARVVLKWPDPKLLKKSESITGFDDYLKSLAEDLYHTMISSFGAGIAAPQVGIHKNLCVIAASYVPSLAPEEFNGITDCVVLVNPCLEPIDNEVFIWDEACLSVPGIQASVSRHKSVRLKYQNLSGEYCETLLTDIESATVQHEIDHLDGKLFIHRLKGASRMIAMKKLRKTILGERKKRTNKNVPEATGKISEQKRLALRKKRKSRKKTTKPKRRK